MGEWLCLVPAKGCSTRLPRTNMLPLGGHPMMATPSDRRSRQTFSLPYAFRPTIQNSPTRPVLMARTYPSCDRNPFHVTQPRSWM